MVKFQYSLQNVLSIKEKMEDQKKMALSDASKHLTTEQGRLGELHHRLDKNNGKFRDTVSDAIKVREIIVLNKLNEFVHSRIKEQHLVIEQASKDVEEKRNELHQALMERQIYEKLKEKDYESYLQEANKEEQKQLDEIVSYKYRKSVQ